MGFSVEESCELANHAVAIVVKQVGSAVVTLQQLIEQVEKK